MKLFRKGTTARWEQQRHKKTLKKYILKGSQKTKMKREKNWFSFSAEIFITSKNSKFLTLSITSFTNFRYNIYFCGFVFCEFLNFAIVGCNFFLTHRFLHYRFLDYGYQVTIPEYFGQIKGKYFSVQVWQYYLLPPEEQRMPGVKNPMCSAFPRVGKLHTSMQEM